MYRWHAFSYEWFGTKSRFARGKSQLFIHELLTEPLIISCNEQAKKTPISAYKGLNVHFQVTRDGKNVHFT